MMSRPAQRARAQTAAALLVLLCAASASAWQHSTTLSGERLHWAAATAQQPIVFGLAADATADLPMAETAVEAAVERAFSAWALPCARTDGTSTPPGVVFAAGAWAAAWPLGDGCGGHPATCPEVPGAGNQIRLVGALSDGTGDAWPFASGIVALSVITSRSATGEIVDADIALHGVAYPLCDDPCPPGGAHLAALLQHEAGHCLGLAHSVAAGSVMAGDHSEAPTSLPPLGDDDRLGGCALYVADACLNKGGCADAAIDAAPAGGCSAGRSGTGGAGRVLGRGFGLIAWALAMVLLRRAQGSRAPSPCRPPQAP